jgi:phosphate-selective porin OprO and OprP
MKSIQSALLATSLLGITSAHAEPGGFLFKGFSGDTPMDQAWSAATLYKDEDNQILQEFSLQGRLHVQSIYGENEDQIFNTDDYKMAGNDESVWGNDFEARRARFGFKSKWFQNWKFDGMINVDTDGHDGDFSDTLYKDLYDLYVTYAPSDALNVSVGKTKVKFSREQEISSNNILTLERSLVSNLMFPGELTGAWVSGKGIQGGWQYELGVYGNDRQREFTDTSGGTIVLGKIGYDYAEQMGYDTAVASIHYMHNTEPGFRAGFNTEYSTGVSPTFTDSIALTNDITQGRFGLTTELLYGFGFDGVPEVNGAPGAAINQANVIALSVIPSYFIADGLQLVGRVQVANGDGADSIRVSSRYERLENSDSFGNTYASAYLGLNYYLYGHKLKLMNGIERSHLGGGEFDGYTIMSGLRFSF